VCTPVRRRRARTATIAAARPVYMDFDDDVADDTEMDDLLKIQHRSRERPVIQWYPGHIAKAERQLKEQLSKVCCFELIFSLRDIVSIVYTFNRLACSCQKSRKSRHPVVSSNQHLRNGEVWREGNADVAVKSTNRQGQRAAAIQWLFLQLYGDVSVAIKPDFSMVRVKFV
jgi:hypothetical protein